MSEQVRPNFATHSIRYVIANMLGIVAGFVSFPIMTRLLDTRQYGIFGYYDAWFALLLSVFKLGGQHSIVRFYPHVGGNAALAGYGANFVLAPFLSANILWLLALGVYAVALQFASPEAPDIGWLMLLSIPFNIWISYVSGVVLAQEHSQISVRITVGQRWVEAAVILGLVYFVQRNADSVYIGRLIVGALLALGLWAWLRKRLPMSLRDFNGAEFVQGLRFGLPMVVNEVVHVMLAFLDRFMLRQMLKDFTAVGVYTIGYGLAMTISGILNTAIRAAYTQVSVREFETLGAAAVVRTKKSILNILIYIAVGLIVGLLTVGGDVLLILAGNDKTSSIPVFVFVSINYVLDGIVGICATGLLLHKRSSTELGLTMGALFINIALNLIWIPEYRLMGAVYATFVSYIALGVARYFFCPKDLRALPGRNPTYIAICLGLITWAVAYYTNLLGISSHIGRLGLMAMLTLILFAGPAVLLDGQLRESLAKFWRNRNPVG
jgi:O-antigen/teichoic acid export membrane protein